MAVPVVAQPSQATKAQLYLRCTDLPDMDITSKTDAQITVWISDARGKRQLGKTEVVNDNLNPIFAKSIPVRRQSLSIFSPFSAHLFCLTHPNPAYLFPDPCIVRFLLRRGPNTYV